MLDYLQATFWSLTYVLLIIYAIRFNRHGIPLVAVCLNFAWETVALAGSILGGIFSIELIIHVAWFSLDLIIILLYLFYEKRHHKWEKVLFILFYICLTALLAYLFIKGYMLLSCFCIDLNF